MQRLGVCRRIFLPDGLHIVHRLNIAEQAAGGIRHEGDMIVLTQGVLAYYSVDAIR